MKLKTDKAFTPSFKKKASVVCGVAVLLWVILRKIFSMEFYSLFFASAVGSNILLLMMIIVLSIPSNMLFSKLHRAELSLTLSLVCDIVLMFACAYTFSIFRYEKVWTVILTMLLHIGAKVFIAANADEDVKELKRIDKSRKKAAAKNTSQKNDKNIFRDDGTLIPLIKRKPLRTAVLSAVQAAAQDGIFLLLMYTMAKIFTD